MKFSNQGIELLKQLEGHVTRGNLHIIYDDKTGRPIDGGAPLPHGAAAWKSPRRPGRQNTGP